MCNSYYSKRPKIKLKKTNEQFVCLKKQKIILIIKQKL